ncbi:MAG: PAS domain-containing protein [Euryarchaeota archaeon]|nr:PAS domain-containing protein [Euryarchaeota archaeon]
MATDGPSARSEDPDAVPDTSTGESGGSVDEDEAPALAAHEPFSGIDADVLFDAVPNPVLVIDRGGRITAANPECAILLGRPQDHLVGHRLEDLVALSTERFQDPIRATWEHTKPIKDVPGVIRLGQTEIHVVVSATKIETRVGPSVLLMLKNATRDQAVIRAIRDVARRAARTADGLAMMGEGTASKVEEIRGSMREIAQGTQVQASKVEETVDVIKGLAMSIDTINSLASEAAGRAVTVADEARTGTEVAERALDRLGRIIEGVESSKDLVVELARHIEEVEGILGFVKEISQKTNMLALNAAIEAARAGEHGRAFGVVADEVKRLSDHTRDSIRDISRIIEEAKRDTNQVVLLIQDRTAEVKDSAQVVRGALERFETVASEIMASTDLVERISHATTEQKRGAGAIVSAIDEVAAVAEEASTNTEHTSALANEMAESVEALTAATTELTAIAGSLHNTLDRYFQQHLHEEGPWSVGDVEDPLEDPEEDEGQEG